MHGRRRPSKKSFELMAVKFVYEGIAEKTVVGVGSFQEDGQSKGDGEGRYLGHTT